MAQAVIMPKLGQTVEVSTIVKWNTKVGDTVQKGDILFEIETDKAVLEVDSFFEGTLLKILVKEGETVPVTTTVAFIGEAGETVPDVVPPVVQQAVEKKTPASTPVKTAPAKTVAAEPAKQVQQVFAETVQSSELPPRHHASPRARKLLKDSAVSSDAIFGTGQGGRIVER
ncbi:MAG: biotin/lipoyl-binding protein, partial [Lentisphaerae bacterium]|nr:biotin/lipoyl-binding protein [Lentisphaerota bacterium]